MGQRNRWNQKGYVECKGKKVELSKDPKGYVKKMKQRDTELSKGWGQIVTPLSVQTATYHSIGGFVVVTFMRPVKDGTQGVSINVPKEIIEQLTERQGFIVDCIIHKASVSQTEMSQKAGVSRKTIQREIENIRSKGLKISREGSKKDGKWLFKEQ